jgi:hypothetical protein
LSFRVHKKDKQDLECYPTTVYCHIFPANSSEGNWIDIVGKEKAYLAKDLLDSNTTGPDGVWKQLNKVGCNFVSTVSRWFSG